MTLNFESLERKMETNVAVSLCSSVTVTKIQYLRAKLEITKAEEALFLRVGS
jgi:hypothetical protein